MIFSSTRRLGAGQLPRGGGRFEVWAPAAERVELHLLPPSASPEDTSPPPLALEPLERGYWELETQLAEPGSRYLYLLDGELERADPASRSQPQGVHGPSELAAQLSPVEAAGWKGLPLDDYVLYELHVGTFTAEGTFDAAASRLVELKELGITAVELMPVGEFPGPRNWGYDGVFPFAAQSTYGGSAGLRRLVDAAHELGMAAVLDVVYNHLGPEGNHFGDFGPYFSADYRTPWGAALNFDGPGSDEVRRFFIENALYWTLEVGFDALRLDALHALLDRSAKPFLAELAAEVHAAAHQRGRLVYLIAESDTNDPRLLLPPEQGGFALDAHWNDDFHHALHSVLTGERAGYYGAYGTVEQLARAYQEGYVYSGQYSPFWGLRHGSSSRGMPPRKFVVYSQNHDQIGNRRLGERLTSLVDFHTLKLAAVAVILSPFLPLLFMGEEYGEEAPFLYFTSHTDSGLAEAVRQGRRAVFAAAGGWTHGESRVLEPPDPQMEETFSRSRLDWDSRRSGRHATLLSFYRKLLELRRELPALRRPDRESLEVAFSEEQRTVTLLQRSGMEQAFLALHMGGTRSPRPLVLPAGEWTKELDSAEERWLGAGSELPWLITAPGEHRLRMSPLSAALFRHPSPSGGR